MKWKRDFGTLSSDQDVYVIPLPSRLRDLCGIEDRKIVRAIGSGWLQGNSIFQTQHGRCTYKHIESVRDFTWSAKDQTRQKPSIQELSILPLVKEIMSSYNPAKKEIQFSWMGWHWVCQLYSRADLTPRISYPTWTQLHGLIWFDLAWFETVGENIKLGGKTGTVGEGLQLVTTWLLGCGLIDFLPRCGSTSGTFSHSAGSCVACLDCFGSNLHLPFKQRIMVCKFSP